MKKLALLLFAVSLSTFAQQQVFEFEATPGCMWSKSRGTCVMSNKYRTDITCAVTLRGTTFKGRKVGNMQTVTIGSGKFHESKVFVQEGDVLTYLEAQANCRAE